MTYLRLNAGPLISYEEIASMEMQDVDLANRHLMVLMFDREKEMMVMRRKVHTHAWKMWATKSFEIKAMDEELYQWSKRVD